MRRRHSQRGANLVEAALTMLLFFGVMFAIFDFGRALNVYHAMTDAAREGARYAVAPFPGTATLPTTAQVQTFVQNYLAAASVTVAPANITVNPAFSQTFNGSPVLCTQVAITTPYTFIVLPFSITLATDAVMRNETD